MKKIFLTIGGLISSSGLAPSWLRDMIMWPLATRVLGLDYRQVVEMKDGFKMLGSMQDILSRGVLFVGPYKKYLWEPETSKLLERLSRDSKEILIAGAHMGYLVLLSAGNTRGRVHTFEPIPHLFSRLGENVDLNPDLKNKILINKEALGEKVGELEMYSEDIRSSFIPYGGGHLSHKNLVSVPITTVDTYAKKSGVEKFDLILLDVEGFEWFVLNGAEEILRSRPHLILEISPKILAHTQITEEMIFTKLDKMGYEVSYLDRDKDYANIYAKY